MGEIIDSGLGTKLNQARRLGSIMFRSDPSDVARVEKRDGDRQEALCTLWRQAAPGPHHRLNALKERLNNLE
jgi:GTP-dependent phosphoenolpyruvate carboxykinase